MPLGTFKAGGAQHLTGHGKEIDYDAYLFVDNLQVQLLVFIICLDHVALRR